MCNVQTSSGKSFDENTLLWLKSWTAIKALSLYFNLCLYVKLDGLACLFTSISFLTNNRLYISIHTLLWFLLHWNIFFVGTIFIVLQKDISSQSWLLINLTIIIHRSILNIGNKYSKTCLNWTSLRPTFVFRNSE
jgi:hypothetical protein